MIPVIGAAATITWEDFYDLLFWGGVLVFGMIALFVIQKGIRFGIQRRVRSIHAKFGMRPDDLQGMVRTGLISEEERRRINEAVARNLLKESYAVVDASQKEETRKKTRGAGLGDEGSTKPVGGPGGRDETPSLSAPKEAVSPEMPDSASRPRGKPKPSIDIERLLESGIITRDEYERLKDRE